MKIAVDRNQVQAGSHYKSNFRNHRALAKMGHELVITVLPYGDYCEVTSRIEEMMGYCDGEPEKIDLAGCYEVAIDRKNSIDEVCGNVCSATKEHNRFRKECVRARNNGCRFIVLIEDDTVGSLDELEKWENPRAKKYFIQKARQAKGYKLKYPLAKQPPASGKTLAKALRTMTEKYGVEFVFCKPEDAAQRIVEILKGGNE